MSITQTQVSPKRDSPACPPPPSPPEEQPPPYPSEPNWLIDVFYYKPRLWYRLYDGWFLFLYIFRCGCVFRTERAMLDGSLCKLSYDKLCNMEAQQECLEKFRRLLD